MHTQCTCTKRACRNSAEPNQPSVPRQYKGNRSAVLAGKYSAFASLAIASSASLARPGSSHGHHTVQGAVPSPCPSSPSPVLAMPVDPARQSDAQQSAPRSVPPDSEPPRDASLRQDASSPLPRRVEQHEAAALISHTTARVRASPPRLQRRPRALRPSAEAERTARWGGALLGLRRRGSERDALPAHAVLFLPQKAGGRGSTNEGEEEHGDAEEEGRRQLGIRRPKRRRLALEDAAATHVSG